ncbi:MAG: hypothetical protein IT384_25960 [Deltaproteobacteria bacterium]|nr:hypothetical protein [Deltaproteobacteria bacterium]
MSSPPTPPRARRLTARGSWLRFLAAGVLAVVGSVLAVLLYPRMPPIEHPRFGPEAEARGRAMLERLLDARGGLERVMQGAFEARLEDRWGRVFEAFSIWPGYTLTDGELAFDARGEPYRARVAFRDGNAWGFDGRAAWVLEHGDGTTDSPVIPRARYASWMYPRLMLLPFSIAIEEAEVRALGSVESGGAELEVLEARFKRPTRKIRDRWLLFIDPNDQRITRVAFAETASDPNMLESCTVRAEEQIGELRLLSELDCAMSSRLAPGLHTLRFFDIRRRDTLPPATFALPRRIRPLAGAVEGGS